MWAVSITPESLNNACPVKALCPASDHGRQARSCDADYLGRVRAYHETEAYQKAMPKRKV